MADPAGSVLEYPGMALAAAVVGVALTSGYLAAEYLALPAWRLRRARSRGPAAVAALLGSERLRLRRIYERATVLQKHGHSDAKAVRQDADLGRPVLGALEQKIGAPYSSDAPPN